jgi:hypothetical protein
MDSYFILNVCAPHSYIVTVLLAAEVEGCNLLRRLMSSVQSDMKQKAKNNTLRARKVVLLLHISYGTSD